MPKESEPVKMYKCRCCTKWYSSKDEALSCHDILTFTEERTAFKCPKCKKIWAEHYLADRCCKSSPKSQVKTVEIIQEQKSIKETKTRKPRIKKNPVIEEIKKDPPKKRGRKPKNSTKE